MKKALSSEQLKFLDDLTVQYGDMLTKYAYRFFGYQPNKLETAQDAVQDTFLKAVQDVDSLMAHPNKAAWLKVSLKYTLFNIQREPHWQHEELQPTITDSMSRKIAVTEALDHIEHLPRLEEVIAIANTILSEGEIDTFYDHFLIGLTTEETAILEGVPNATVHGRIGRIRKKLRKYFGLSCYFFLILFYISQGG